jgi:hypothetical protein
MSIRVCARARARVSTFHIFLVQAYFTRRKAFFTARDGRQFTPARARVGAGGWLRVAGATGVQRVCCGPGCADSTEPLSDLGPSSAPEPIEAGGPPVLWERCPAELKGNLAAPLGSGFPPRPSCGPPPRVHAGGRSQSFKFQCNVVNSRMHRYRPATALLNCTPRQHVDTCLVSLSLQTNHFGWFDSDSEMDRQFPRRQIYFKIPFQSISTFRHIFF